MVGELQRGKVDEQEVRERVDSNVSRVGMGLRRLDLLEDGWAV